MKFAELTAFFVKLNHVYFSGVTIEMNEKMHKGSLWSHFCRGDINVMDVRSHVEFPFATGCSAGNAASTHISHIHPSISYYLHPV